MSAPSPLTPPAFVGTETEVPCLDGSWRRYAHLDDAATTPALQSAKDAVDACLPWYSSVHRGAGFKAQVTAEAVAGARAAVAELVDSRPDDTVIFVRGTTEAINLLSQALPAKSRILSSPAEHHADMLPWRRHRVDLLPWPESPATLLADTEAALAAADGEIRLVAVTGASNVTGEVWPVAELAEIAHRWGAELLVDAAQLIPHRAFSLTATGADYVAFSGHKLYAPYGAGALVGRPGLLAEATPMIAGGGATRTVGLDDVSWSALPGRHEAGSPNVPGIVALGAACDALLALGMDAVAARERTIAGRLRRGLRQIEGVSLLALWPDESLDRVGVTTFVCAEWEDRVVASILGAEHAIGLRSGRFCAHPLMDRLLPPTTTPDPSGTTDPPAAPGALRASVGLDTTDDDVDRLLAALTAVLARGTDFAYSYDAAHGDYRPVHDPRPRPSLPIRLVRPEATQ